MIWLYAAFGMLVLLGVAWAVWKLRPADPLVVAGLAGFLACFLPVSGLLAVPVEFTADRLSYVPSLFLALALGSALDRHILQGTRWLIPACGVWALVLAALVFRQAGYWQDERSIVDRTLSLYPASVPAQLNAAVLAGLAGRSDEALRGFRKIRASHPLYEVVWSNEMALLLQEGRPQEAAALGKESVRNIPGSPTLNYKVGVLLTDLGRPEEALAYLRRARELSPHGVQPAFHLARALVASGEIKEAIPVLELLEASLQGDPQYWEVRHQAHDRNGDWQKAARAKQMTEKLRSRPKN